jgi:beta-galactosidase
VNINPHDSKIVLIPHNRSRLIKSGEYFLNLSVRLKNDLPFRPAGFEVAHEQFKLLTVAHPEVVSDKNHPVAYYINDTAILVTGANFELGFDRSTGEISFYEINGMNLIDKGLSLNFWRAPNDNDKGSNMIGRLGVWRKVSGAVPRPVVSCNQAGDGSVEVIALYALADVKSEASVKYTIRDDGTVNVICTFTKGSDELPDMPRFGLRMEMPVNYDNLTWFGRGPHENYIDRNRGSFVGLYSGKVADQYFRYVRPQENGYKSDVRWFELRNENGNGFRISAASDETIGFSALHNPVEDFDQKTHNEFRHTNDIVKRDGVFICIDKLMMGVAGDNSWGARPYPEYSVPAKDYSFSFTMQPVF